MKKIYHRLLRILIYYNQYFTRQIKYVNNSLSKQVALTFDDGPHPVFTGEVLSILREYKISATFFLSGTAIEESHEIVKEIYLSGHIPGNHGYKHVSPERLSAGELISGFEKTDSLINKLCGRTMINFYRPPYGKSTKPYLAWINKNKKYTVKWSLDSYDYRKEYNAGQIADMLLRDVKNGDIILFHDTKPDIREILKKVIPGLLKQNFRFVTPDVKFK